MHAKMRRVLALALFLGLVAQAHSLQCYSCHSPGENCSLGQRNNICNDALNHTCITYTSRIKLASPISGFHEMQTTFRSCGTCTDLISFNSGRTSFFQHTACCNSDLCNNQTEPEKENMTLNGLECEGCLAMTETMCNESMAAVSCHGEQNRCIHATANFGNTTHIAKGCASESLCNEQSIIPYFPFKLSNVTCCQENRCNKGSQDNNTASAINTQYLLITLLLVSWATVL